MRSKFFLIFLFMISFISLASAVAPATQINIGDNGYEIEYPKYDYVAQDSSFDLYLHVFNRTDGSVVNYPTCTLHFYNQTGGHIVESNFSLNSNNLEYTLNIDTGNFSTLGMRSYTMFCYNDDNTLGGFASGTLIVNLSGYEPTVARAIFYIGLLFLIVVFLLIGIYGFVEAEEMWPKTAALGINYLLLTAISFIAWNMAGNFLLSAPFLIAFLRIIFLVLIIGFFPFLILLFAYGFYMIIQIEEIKKLQDQGFDPEEAAEIVKKRKRAFK